MVGASVHCMNGLNTEFSPGGRFYPKPILPGINYGLCDEIDQSLKGVGP